MWAPAVKPLFLGAPTVCQAVGTYCESGPGFPCEHLCEPGSEMLVGAYCVSGPGLLCGYVLCERLLWAWP